MPAGLDFKTIRTVRAIVRAVKKGDMDSIDKLMKDAPVDVREKIKKIAGVYNEAREGKVDKDTAIKAILEELGMGDKVNTLDDILGLIVDLLEE